MITNELQKAAMTALQYFALLLSCQNNTRTLIIAVTLLLTFNPNSTVLLFVTTTDNKVPAVVFKFTTELTLPFQWIQLHH